MFQEKVSSSPKYECYRAVEDHFGRILSSEVFLYTNFGGWYMKRLILFSVLFLVFSANCFQNDNREAMGVHGCLCEQNVHINHDK